MRGYLPAWSVRLLFPVASAPGRVWDWLPGAKPGQPDPERLEVLERLSHEERRARRAGEYVPDRPLGWLAQNVIAPRLGARRPVPGPPKRFAQGMGAGMATIALLGWLAGANALADVVLAMFVFAAGLESIFGYCLGCKIFAGLMR